MMKAIALLSCLFFGALEGINAESVPELELERRDDGSGGVISEGVFRVWEDRDAERGRRLELDVVVLHARAEDALGDPVFVLAGGPGQAAATMWRMYLNHWMRTERDIVLMSQRGTGGSNALHFRPRSSGGVRFEPLFDIDRVDEVLRELSKRADLTQYSTPRAMDDLNDLRRALGYERINLVGGSYGTRASLVYMRRHPQTVRSAILDGCAPLAFVNPLYHAQAAQGALDALFEECRRDSVYRATYPELEKKFSIVLDRLERKPAQVPVSGGMISMGRDDFADAVRVLMYSVDGNRRVPRLILRAYQGDFKDVAEFALVRRRGVTSSLALGMLLCVTCAEDVDRIREGLIAELTQDTFYGDHRVRTQIEVCEKWPRSKLPEGFGDPVRSDTIPVLILSGTVDPVTPPRWGDEVASNFARSLHIVAPGAHGLGGSCIQSIKREFLSRARVEGLDTECVESISLPRIQISH